MRVKTKQLSYFLRSSLRISASHACVYICHRTSGNSVLLALGHPFCGFSKKKWSKNKNTQSPPFPYDAKMAANGVQSINTQRVSLIPGLSVEAGNRRISAGCFFQMLPRSYAPVIIVVACSSLCNLLS